jgi:protein TonB
MKNSVNLNSSEWCDIIFEGKNKSYGAFELRQSSWKRHLWAFGIVLIIVGFVASLPAIISTVAANTGGYDIDRNEIYSVMDVIDNREEQVIEQPEIPEPPVVYRKMEKFVVPVIVDNSEVTNENEMASMTDLLEKKDAVIGKYVVDNGSTDPAAERKVFEREVVEGSGTGGAGKTEDTPIVFAEQMPQFPGGEAEMYRYIKDNLKYPISDQEIGIEGKVTVRFVVGKTGEIGDLQLLKGVSVNCDREAMRVIKGMPKWIPGRNNGEPVKVYFTLPIVFKLSK